MISSIISLVLTCLSIQNPPNLEIYWTQTPLAIRVNHLKQNPPKNLFPLHLSLDFKQICAHQKKSTALNTSFFETLDLWTFELQHINPILEAIEWIYLPSPTLQTSFLALEEQLQISSAILEIYEGQNLIWRRDQAGAHLDQIDIFLKSNKALTFKIDMRHVKKNTKRKAFNPPQKKTDILEDLTFMLHQKNIKNIDLSSPQILIYQGFKLEPFNQTELISTFSFEYHLHKNQKELIEKQAEHLKQIPCLIGLLEESQIIQLPNTDAQYPYVKLRGYQRCVYPISLLYKPFVILLDHSSLQSIRAEIDFTALSDLYAQDQYYPLKTKNFAYFLSQSAFGQSDQRGEVLIYQDIPKLSLSAKPQQKLEQHGLRYQPYPQNIDELDPEIQQKISAIQQRSVSNTTFAIKGVLWSSQWFFDLLIHARLEFQGVEVDLLER